MIARASLSPLTIILALLLLAATVAGFVLIPAGGDLPVHWGPTGVADGFMPRTPALLLLPVIAFLTVALVLAVQRLSSAERQEASRHLLAVTIPGVLAIFLAIQVGIVLIGIGHAVDMVRIVVGAIGVLFVVLGNVLPKSQPNWIAGIRLPWTLADRTNWQATHRLGGRLMLAGGIVIIFAVLATGDAPVLLAVMLAAVLLPMLIATVYSWRLYRRDHVATGQSRP